MSAATSPNDPRGGARISTIEVGDEIPTVSVVLDATFIREHATAIDMGFPRFTDDAGAKAEGLPGQIAPGNMTLALLARGLLAWAPGGRLMRLGTTFRSLAVAGTAALLHGVVTEIDDAEGRVECDVWIESAGGDRLVMGTATMVLPE